MNPILFQMPAGSITVLVLPTFLIVLNNVVEPESDVTVLNNITENNEKWLAQWILWHIRLITWVLSYWVITCSLHFQENWDDEEEEKDKPDQTGLTFLMLNYGHSYKTE